MTGPLRLARNRSAQVITRSVGWRQVGLAIRLEKVLCSLIYRLNVQRLEQDSKSNVLVKRSVRWWTSLYCGIQRARESALKRRHVHNLARSGKSEQGGCHSQKSNQEVPLKVVARIQICFKMGRMPCHLQLTTQSHVCRSWLSRRTKKRYR